MLIYITVCTRVLLKDVYVLLRESARKLINSGGEDIMLTDGIDVPK